MQRQVETVLSRLREAPGSRYAFAITNTFLSQIPSSLSGTLLPTPSSPDDEEENIKREEEEPSLAGQERDRRVDESLSIELDSIALDASPRSAHATIPSKRHVSLSSTGASEVLSASMRADYTTAASQVLSAALPSFIPSMVAPLVCVFSYPVPYPSEEHLEQIQAHAHHLRHAQQPKGVTFPWGLPDRPSTHQHPSTTTTTPPPPPTGGPSPLPDPGIIVVRSEAWTQAEREALYLAATRFRLSGQWSKIREMMNLHRTDKEIEAEYMKLYGHRHDDIDDDDDDDDDHHDNDIPHDDLRPVRVKMEDRFGNMDGDADDEAESAAVFMRFGGGNGGSRRSTTASQWHQQQLQQQQQRLSSQPREPIRLHEKELMIDKRFALEEIPMRL